MRLCYESAGERIEESLPARNGLVERGRIGNDFLRRLQQTFQRSDHGPGSFPDLIEWLNRRGRRLITSDVVRAETFLWVAAVGLADLIEALGLLASGRLDHLVRPSTAQVKSSKAVRSSLASARRFTKPGNGTERSTARW